MDGIREVTLELRGLDASGRVVRHSLGHTFYGAGCFGGTPGRSASASAQRGRRTALCSGSGATPGSTDAMAEGAGGSAYNPRRRRDRERGYSCRMRASTPCHINSAQRAYPRSEGW